MLGDNYHQAEAERRLGSSLGIGVVHEYREISEGGKKYPQVRIKDGDLVTGWLYCTTERAGGVRSWSPVDDGEQVAYALIAGGETGFVIRSIFSFDFPVNGSGRDIHRVDYDNGDFTEHNRETGNMKLSISGALDFDIGGRFKVNCAELPWTVG